MRSSKLLLGRSIHFALKHWERAVSVLFLLALVSGCAPATQMAPNLAQRHVITKQSLGSSSAASKPTKDKVPFLMPPGHKKLLVFLDGTSNQWDSRTNVRRLFEMIGSEENPERLCFYVEGVGDEWYKLIGQAFGYGMKPRIVAAYAFLSEYYQPGDEIYIFGFSRGSHQARALAGLISHCGLMDTNGITPSAIKRRAKEMVEWCNKTCEGTSEADWIWSITNNTPLYPSRLAYDTRLTNSFPCANRYAEIKFLGVWDTVPGSSFKDFGPTGELEDGKPGIRYKMGPYPPIKEIAHALSLNEQRRMFRPVLFGQPMDTNTILHQEWFAGVHSDVGGGYEDSSELPGVTLNWMLSFLKTNGLLSKEIPTVAENPKGLEHDSWSASCLWQWWAPEPRWRPADAKIHQSVTNERVGALVWRNYSSRYSYQTNYAVPTVGVRPREWREMDDQGVNTNIHHSVVGEVGQTNVFLIEPTKPWNRTGYRLEKGKTYTFKAEDIKDAECNDYADKSIRCNPDGPVGRKGKRFDSKFRDPGIWSPIRWFGPGKVTRLRVLQDKDSKRASFLTVIGAIGPDDRQTNVFVIGSGRDYVAHESGELVVFCNDWPGGRGECGDARFTDSKTYANNKGLIRLTIEARP